MALPTSNLIMVGLGTSGDAPPNAEQPPLVDGIHLRWTFTRELGFPWFGFYLFRRVHERGTISWLSQHTGKLPKGTQSSNTLDTPLGRVVSDKNLVLTEDFPPTDAVELDLADRSLLAVVFPETQPVRYIEARIGFRSRPGDPPPTKSTITFTGLSTSAGPNPRTENGVVFEALDKRDRPRPNTFIRSVQTSTGAITGLGCKFELNITLPQPSTFVEVTLTGAGRRNVPDATPTIEVFNQDGTRADGATMRDPRSREPETFLLVGTAITRVVIDERLADGEKDDDQERVILNEISFGSAAISEVEVTAFAATTPVRQTRVRGYAGRMVTTQIEFEGISSVQFASAPAALIDLGTVALSQGVTTGWTRLPQFTYPLRLPITHPDYPCTPQINEDFARSRQLASERIQYGSPQQFTSVPVPITKAGTVSVTNGSPVVVGVNTNWTNELLDGVLQVSGDATVYTVVMVVSPTKLVLSRNYSGTTRNAAQYVVSRDRFGQFYDYLVSLVAGGNAAAPMVSRTLPAPVATSGTVAIAKDLSVVQGTGTNWGSHLAGLDFQLEEEQIVYPISSVQSATSLTLERPYSGESVTAKAYRIGARLQSSVAGALTPRMPAQSPLDMVLLGTLHPAVAQMGGLYWIDRTADPAESYDYLVVGDYNGVAQLNADNMLAIIQQSGFSNVDGSIVYNLRIAPAPALTSPDKLEVYALPGSTRHNETGAVEQAVNNAGLRWNLNKTELGVLLPGRAVMYHVWRANLGNDATPGLPARFDLITKNWPVLVTDAANALPPSPDWPPFPMHALDNALSDGWYGYQVSGIDIFGRHTPNSVAGVWRQWAPAPEPRPWYYVDLPSDAVIHPTAIRLLTKTAPPPPTATEAFALDPADPAVIKDAVYTQWWTRLNNASWYQSVSDVEKKNLIGLRVRWQWPQSHTEQAPHTREFRIYYQDGSLNAVLGNTQTVTPAGSSESDVATDISNPGPADSYVGTALYAGDDAFVVVGSYTENPLRVRVRNVGPNNEIAPPANAPCTIATPPVYSAGLASVANGSRVVTGEDTGWTTNLEGMLFQIATDDRSYRIASVISESQLVLVELYAGASKGDRIYGIRHPRFVDYSAPRSWGTRFYVVPLDQHWTPGTDAAGQPVRNYEVILPVPEEALHDGVPLAPSRGEPIVYAHVGVSAADGKSYTADDPKWTGPWAGRVGNEGRVGPPAKIFRVLREAPPAPMLPRMPERMFATRADQSGASFYTFRWQPLQGTMMHLFRGFDEAVFQVDWAQRPRPPLDPAKIFPDETIDPRWNAAKRQQVETELNQLNTFGHDAAGTVHAFNYYRALSADALRVLAGLPGNDAAFTQVTTTPLDPDDANNANRRGPDDADDFQTGDPGNPLASPNLRLFTDTLDGRTTNRYFYRVAYVDTAHNRSAFSLAGAPVFLHDVSAPGRPVLLEPLGGNKTLTVRWITNTEHNLDHYLLYRTDSSQAAQNVTLMRLHEKIGKDATSATMQFVDNVVPRITFYYRLVAVDVSGNSSAFSDLVAGQAYQSPPDRPTLALPVWDAAHRKVTLAWSASNPKLESRLERRLHGGAIWIAATGWLAPGHYTHEDEPPEPADVFHYRVRTRDDMGQVSVPSLPEVTP